MGDTEADGSTLRVVGLGASAGGLKPLESFFERVPSNTGAAFVVIQHLSPTHRSMMDELLTRRTEMPVCFAEDGIELLPDTIYLSPPGRTLELHSERLHFVEPETRKPLRTIDIFLRSLAEIGPRAIGVVLSGTGTDGTHGIKAINASGGVTMAQSPSSAAFDGMPQSVISTGVVDFVLPPEQLADALTRCLKQPHELDDDSSEEMSDALLAITELLSSNNQVDFNHYRESVLRRRIQNRLLLTGSSSHADYLELLKRDTNEQEVLRRDLLICVTRFFRDRSSWEILASRVLPTLFDQARPEEGLRIWISACATGEEAFTVCILLLEEMERRGTRIPIRIFATDANPDVIVQAASGLYTAAAVDQLTAQQRSRFFLQQGERWLVKPEVRRLITFAHHDLTRHAPFTRMDLVTCRNVLIYMQPSLQLYVLRMLLFAMRVGGALMLGRAETAVELAPALELLDSGANLYRKTRQDLRGPRFPMPKAPRVTRPARLVQAKQEAPLATRSIRLLAHSTDSLILILSDAAELLQIFGDSSDILRFPEGSFTGSLSELVPDSLHLVLYAAIQKLKGGQDVVPSSQVSIRQGDDVHKLDVSVTADREGATPMFIAQLRRRGVTGVLSEEVDLDETAAAHIRELELELEILRQRLQAQTQELETSNEEQQATNEELIASNEELQGTNEELQAVNEELHTLNTEYQSRLSELTELGDDIDNLLRDVYVGTLFLNQEGCIRRFTRRVPELINLMPHDIGRPLSHFTHRFIEEIDLPRFARKAMQTNLASAFDVTLREPKLRMLRMLIGPYLRNSRDPDGVTITFTDVTESWQQKRALLQTVDECLQPHAVGLWSWMLHEDHPWLSPQLRSALALPDDTVAALIDRAQLSEHAESGHPTVDVPLPLPGTPRRTLHLRFGVERAPDNTITSFHGCGWITEDVPT